MIFFSIFKFILYKESKTKVSELFIILTYIQIQARNLKKKLTELFNCI